MALQCLKEIAENSKEQTELLVDLKLSNILFEFLKIDDPSLKFLACRILNLMATVESSVRYHPIY